MSRKNNILVKRSIYQMSLVTVMASLMWIGIVVYQTMQTPIDIEVKPEMLKPLSPVINGETLDKLITRRQMGEGDWNILNRVIIVQKEKEATGSAIAQP